MARAMTVNGHGPHEGLSAWMLRRLDSPRAVMACFAVLTVVKILSVLILAQRGVVQPFTGDNAIQYYMPIAERLVTEGRFNGPESRDDSWVSIGYPAMLALAKMILPQGFVLLTVAWQMALDGVVAVLLYFLGCWTCGRVAGALAGGLWLVYPPAVLTSTWITAENLFTGVLLASLVLLVLSMKERRGVGMTFGAGVVMGLATLVRGTTILYPQFLFGWLLVGKQRGKWWKGLVFGVGAVVAILPWMVRNKLVLQDNIAISVGIGQSFRQGSDARTFTIEGKQKYIPEMNARAALDGIVRGNSELATAGDKWTFRVAMHEYLLRWRERPLSFVTFGLHKLVRLFYGTESGSFRAQAGMAAFAVLVVPVALWRMWRWRREYPELFVVAGSAVGYFMLLHWLTLPQYRYMHPIMPLLMLALADQVVVWLTPQQVRAIYVKRRAHPAMSLSEFMKANS